jgi:hypothetical protein
MARVSPAPADRIAEFQADFDRAKKQRGYVPNSWYTLARKHLAVSGWSPGAHAP